MTSEQAKERAWVAKAIETWTRRHRGRKRSDPFSGIDRSSEPAGRWLLQPCPTIEESIREGQWLMLMEWPGGA